MMWSCAERRAETTTGGTGPMHRRIIASLTALAVAASLGVTAPAAFAVAGGDAVASTKCSRIHNKKQRRRCYARQQQSQQQG
jgi:hypothetical protein